MKFRTRAVALLLSIVAIMVSAQSVPEGQGHPQDTQIRGYWIDPSTGLMWAGKDNGKDISWYKAMKYCHDLRLAGYSDWRLAKAGELGQIYDRDANAPGLAGPSKEQRAFTFHVKGNLFLTGNQWSSTRHIVNGRLTGYASRFDFNEGRMFDGDELWFFTNKHALCVRDPGKK